MTKLTPQTKSYIDLQATQLAIANSPGLLFYGTRIYHEEGEYLASLKEKIEGTLSASLSLIDRFAGLYIAAVRSTSFVQPGEIISDLDVWSRLEEEEDWRGAIRTFTKDNKIPTHTCISWYLGYERARLPRYIKLMI